MPERRDAAPMDDARWLRALPAIYDAATDSGRWEAAVDALCDIVGARSALLMLTEHGDSRPWHLSAGSVEWRRLDGTRLDQYAREFGHYEAPAFEALRTLPVLTPLSTDDPPDGVTPPPREREDCRFMARHFGCHHRVAIRLNDNGGWFDCVAFQYAAALESVPPAGLRRVRNALPHLAKALELGRAYRQLQVRYRAVLGALDNVRVGIVVVRGDGAPIVVNASARRLLEQADGVRLDGRGRLRFRDEAVQRSFARVVPQVAQTAAGRAGRASVGLSAARLRGGPPILVELTPLRDPLGELNEEACAVSVMLLDPSTTHTIRTDLLASWASLTAAETAVCRHLVDGLTNAGIAERRETSLDTVKSQVARIFAKTGAANRSELVRIACRTSPPIGGEER